MVNMGSHQNSSHFIKVRSAGHSLIDLEREAKPLAIKKHATWHQDLAKYVLQSVQATRSLRQAYDTAENNIK